MAKEFLDPTIFTDPLGALGLLAKSIKKASDYDRNKDKNVFEAVVISPPATDLYVDGSTRTKVYVRLDTQTGHENIPPGHAFLQNPCDLTTDQNPQQSQKALALVKMHTAVYIPEVEEDSGVDPVTLNDRILVRLNPNVFGYDMSEGEYVGAIKKKKKFIAKPEAADEGCKSLAKVFEGNLQQAKSIAALQATATQDTDTFYELLKTHAVKGGYFDGFSDAFLAGLAANSQAESNSDRGAMGDALKGYENYPEKYEIYKERAINGYCSFGYWQLNICPESAEGSLFINKNNLSRADPQKIYEAIINTDKQFEFVAGRLKEIRQINITEKDAKLAGQAIAIYFENCAECDPIGGTKSSETVARGTVAADLYGKVTA